MQQQPTGSSSHAPGSAAGACDRCRLYRRLTLVMAVVVAGLWLIEALAS